MGQRPGVGSKSSYLLSLWGKEEGELGHAERASLWDATGVAVGKAESSSKSVVVQALLMEVAVSSEGA